MGDLAEHVSARASGRASGRELSWAEILAPAIQPVLPRSSIYHRLLVYGSRLGVRLAFRVRARGGDRLPAGPCIIAPNHQSFLDGLFVTAFMRPRAVLSTFFYAKEKHVRTFVLRFLAQRSNTIVMKPGDGIRESLQKLAAALRKGEKVMIFPEGTRSVSGALGAFKESYAILSRELRIPVVPVVIDGANRVLPDGQPHSAVPAARFGDLPRSRDAAGGRGSRELQRPRARAHRRTTGRTSSRRRGLSQEPPGLRTSAAGQNGRKRAAAARLDSWHRSTVGTLPAEPTLPVVGFVAEARRLASFQRECFTLPGRVVSRARPWPCEAGL